LFNGEEGEWQLHLVGGQKGGKKRVPIFVWQGGGPAITKNALGEPREEKL